MTRGFAEESPGGEIADTAVGSETATSILAEQSLVLDQDLANA
jgi:hypothetical protein